MQDSEYSTDFDNCVDWIIFYWSDKLYIYFVWFKMFIVCFIFFCLDTKEPKNQGAIFFSGQINVLFLKEINYSFYNI